MILDLFQPSTMVCRPSTGVCDVAEQCTGSTGFCPVDAAPADRDGDGVCDAADDCPTVANADQIDTDGDGKGDACDPCNNVVPVYVVKPAVTVSRMTAQVGEDHLRFAGDMTFPYPFAPALDPVQKGIRLVIDDARGETLLDATIPGGAFDRSHKAGWKTAKTRTRWTYVNTGTATPMTDGISKIVVKDRSRQSPGRISLLVIGTRGDYGQLNTRFPATATVIFDTPAATTGQCAEASFPNPPVCSYTRNHTMITCKQITGGR